MFPKPTKQLKKRKGLNKQRKTTRAAIIRKLDKEFSIRVRSIGYCQAAGLDTIHCGGVLQCCHIVGRGNYTLRWDRFNALSMCGGHHVYYTHHPEAWRDFITKNFPQWPYLEKKRVIVSRLKIKDLEEMLEALQ